MESVWLSLFEEIPYPTVVAWLQNCSSATTLSVSPLVLSLAESTPTPNTAKEPIGPINPHGDQTCVFNNTKHAPSQQQSHSYTTLSPRQPVGLPDRDISLEYTPYIPPQQHFPFQIFVSQNTFDTFSEAYRSPKSKPEPTQPTIQPTQPTTQPTQPFRKSDPTSGSLSPNLLPPEEPRAPSQITTHLFISPHDFSQAMLSILHSESTKLLLYRWATVFGPSIDHIFTKFKIQLQSSRQCQQQRPHQPRTGKPTTPKSNELPAGLHTSEIDRPSATKPGDRKANTRRVVPSIVNDQDGRNTWSYAKAPDIGKSTMNTPNQAGKPQQTATLVAKRKKDTNSNKSTPHSSRSSGSTSIPTVTSSTTQGSFLSQQPGQGGGGRSKKDNDIATSSLLTPSLTHTDTPLAGAWASGPPCFGTETSPAAASMTTTKSRLGNPSMITPTQPKSGIGPNDLTYDIDSTVQYHIETIIPNPIQTLPNLPPSTSSLTRIQTVFTHFLILCIHGGFLAPTTLWPWLQHLSNSDLLASQLYQSFLSAHQVLIATLETTFPSTSNASPSGLSTNNTTPTSIILHHFSNYDQTPTHHTAQFTPSIDQISPNPTQFTSFPIHQASRTPTHAVLNAISTFISIHHLYKQTINIYAILQPTLALPLSPSPPPLQPRLQPHQLESLANIGHIFPRPEDVVRMVNNVVGTCIYQFIHSPLPIQNIADTLQLVLVMKPRTTMTTAVPNLTSSSFPSTANSPTPSFLPSWSTFTLSVRQRRLFEPGIRTMLQMYHLIPLVLSYCLVLPPEKKKQLGIFSPSLYHPFNFLSTATPQPPHRSKQFLPLSPLRSILQQQPYSETGNNTPHKTSQTTEIVTPTSEQHQHQSHIDLLSTASPTFSSNSIDNDPNLVPALSCLSGDRLDTSNHFPQIMSRTATGLPPVSGTSPILTNKPQLPLLLPIFTSFAIHHQALLESYLDKLAPILSSGPLDGRNMVANKHDALPRNDHFKSSQGHGVKTTLHTSLSTLPSTHTPESNWFTSLTQHRSVAKLLAKQTKALKLQLKSFSTVKLLVPSILSTIPNYLDLSCTGQLHSQEELGRSRLISQGKQDPLFTLYQSLSNRYPVSKSSFDPHFNLNIKPSLRFTKPRLQPGQGRDDAGTDENDDDDGDDDTSSIIAVTTHQTDIINDSPNQCTQSSTISISIPLTTPTNKPLSPCNAQDDDDLNYSRRSPQIPTKRSPPSQDANQPFSHTQLELHKTANPKTSTDSSEITITLCIDKRYLRQPPGTTHKGTISLKNSSTNSHTSHSRQQRFTTPRHNRCTESRRSMVLSGDDNGDDDDDDNDEGQFECLNFDGSDDDYQQLSGKKTDHQSSNTNTGLGGNNDDLELLYGPPLDNPPFTLRFDHLPIKANRHISPNPTSLSYLQGDINLNHQLVYDYINSNQTNISNIGPSANLIHLPATKITPFLPIETSSLLPTPHSFYFPNSKVVPIFQVDRIPTPNPDSSTRPNPETITQTIAQYPLLCSFGNSTGIRQTMMTAAHVARTDTAIATQIANPIPVLAPLPHFDSLQLLKTNTINPIAPTPIFPDSFTEINPKFNRSKHSSSSRSNNLGAFSQSITFPSPLGVDLFEFGHQDRGMVESIAGVRLLNGLSEPSSSCSNNTTIPPNQTASGTNVDNLTSPANDQTNPQLSSNSPLTSDNTNPTTGVGGQNSTLVANREDAMDWLHLLNAAFQQFQMLNISLVDLDYRNSTTGHHNDMKHSDHIHVLSSLSQLPTSIEDGTDSPTTRSLSKTLCQYCHDHLTLSDKIFTHLHLLTSAFFSTISTIPTRLDNSSYQISPNQDRNSSIGSIYEITEADLVIFHLKPMRLLEGNYTWFTSFFLEMLIKSTFKPGIISQEFVPPTNSPAYSPLYRGTTIAFPTVIIPQPQPFLFQPTPQRLSAPDSCVRCYPPRHYANPNSSPPRHNDQDGICACTLFKLKLYGPQQYFLYLIIQSNNYQCITLFQSMLKRKITLLYLYDTTGLAGASTVNGTTSASAAKEPSQTSTSPEEAPNHQKDLFRSETMPIDILTSVDTLSYDTSRTHRASIQGSSHHYRHTRSNPQEHNNMYNDDAASAASIDLDGVHIGNHLANESDQEQLARSLNDHHEKMNQFLSTITIRLMKLRLLARCLGFIHFFSRHQHMYSGNSARVHGVNNLPVPEQAAYSSLPQFPIILQTIAQSHRNFTQNLIPAQPSLPQSFPLGDILPLIITAHRHNSLSTLFPWLVELLQFFPLESTAQTSSFYASLVILMKIWTRSVALPKGLGSNIERPNSSSTANGPIQTPLHQHQLFSNGIMGVLTPGQPNSYPSLSGYNVSHFAGNHTNRIINGSHHPVLPLTLPFTLLLRQAIRFADTIFTSNNTLPPYQKDELNMGSDQNCAPSSSISQTLQMLNESLFLGPSMSTESNQTPPGLGTLKQLCSTHFSPDGSWVESDHSESNPVNLATMINPYPLKIDEEFSLVNETILQHSFRVNIHTTLVLLEPLFVLLDLDKLPQSPHHRIPDLTTNADNGSNPSRLSTVSLRPNFAPNPLLQSESRAPTFDLYFNWFLSQFYSTTPDSRHAHSHLISLCTSSTTKHRTTPQVFTIFEFPVDLIPYPVISHSRIITPHLQRTIQSLSAQLDRKPILPSPQPLSAFLGRYHLSDTIFTPIKTLLHHKYANWTLSRPELVKLDIVLASVNATRDYIFLARQQLRHGSGDIDSALLGDDVRDRDEQQHAAAIVAPRPLPPSILPSRGSSIKPANPSDTHTDATTPNTISTKDIEVVNEMKYTLNEKVKAGQSVQETPQVKRKIVPLSINQGYSDRILTCRQADSHELDPQIIATASDNNTTIPDHVENHFSSGQPSSQFTITSTPTALGQLTPFQSRLIHVIRSFVEFCETDAYDINKPIIHSIQTLLSAPSLQSGNYPTPQSTTVTAFFGKGSLDTKLRQIHCVPLSSLIHGTSLGMFVHPRRLFDLFAWATQQDLCDLGYLPSPAQPFHLSSSNRSLATPSPSAQLPQLFSSPRESSDELLKVLCSGRYTISLCTNPFIATCAMSNATNNRNNNNNNPAVESTKPLPLSQGEQDYVQIANTTHYFLTTQKTITLLPHLISLQRETLPGDAYYLLVKFRSMVTEAFCLDLHHSPSEGNSKGKPPTKAKMNPLGFDCDLVIHFLSSFLKIVNSPSQTQPLTAAPATVSLCYNITLYPTPDKIQSALKPNPEGFPFQNNALPIPPQYSVVNSVAPIFESNGLLTTALLPKNTITTPIHRGAMPNQHNMSVDTDILPLPNTLSGSGFNDTTILNSASNGFDSLQKQQQPLAPSFPGKYDVGFNTLLLVSRRSNLLTRQIAQNYADNILNVHIAPNCLLLYPHNFPIAGNQSWTDNERSGGLRLDQYGQEIITKNHTDHQLPRFNQPFELVTSNIASFHLFTPSLRQSWLQTLFGSLPNVAIVFQQGKELITQSILNFFQSQQILETIFIPLSKPFRARFDHLNMILLHLTKSTRSSGPTSTTEMILDSSPPTSANSVTNTFINTTLPAIMLTQSLPFIGTQSYSTTILAPIINFIKIYVSTLLHSLVHQLTHTMFYLAQFHVHTMAANFISTTLHLPLQVQYTTASHSSHAAQLQITQLLQYQCMVGVFQHFKDNITLQFIQNILFSVDFLQVYNHLIQAINMTKHQNQRTITKILSQMVVFFEQRANCDRDFTPTSTVSKTTPYNYQQNDQTSAPVPNPTQPLFSLLPTSLAAERLSLDSALYIQSSYVRAIYAAISIYSFISSQWLALYLSSTNQYCITPKPYKNPLNHHSDQNEEANDENSSIIFSSISPYKVDLRAQLFPYLYSFVHHAHPASTPPRLANHHGDQEQAPNNPKLPFLPPSHTIPAKPTLEDTYPSETDYSHILPHNFLPLGTVSADMNWQISNSIHFGGTIPSCFDLILAQIGPMVPDKTDTQAISNFILKRIGFIIRGIKNKASGSDKSTFLTTMTHFEQYFSSALENRISIDSTFMIAMILVFYHVLIVSHSQQNPTQGDDCTSEKITPSQTPHTTVPLPHNSPRSVTRPSPFETNTIDPIHSPLYQFPNPPHVMILRNFISLLLTSIYALPHPTVLSHTVTSYALLSTPLNSQLNDQSALEIDSMFTATKYNSYSYLLQIYTDILQIISDLGIKMNLPSLYTLRPRQKTEVVAAQTLRDCAPMTTSVSKSLLPSATMMRELDQDDHTNSTPASSVSSKPPNLNRFTPLNGDYTHYNTFAQYYLKLPDHYHCQLHIEPKPNHYLTGPYIQQSASSPNGVTSPHQPLLRLDTALAHMIDLFHVMIVSIDTTVQFPIPAPPRSNIRINTIPLPNTHSLSTILADIQLVSTTLLHNPTVAKCITTSLHQPDNCDGPNKILKSVATTLLLCELLIYGPSCLDYLTDTPTKEAMLAIIPPHLLHFAAHTTTLFTLLNQVPSRTTPTVMAPNPDRYGYAYQHPNSPHLSPQQVYNNQNLSNLLLQVTAFQSIPHLFLPTPSNLTNSMSNPASIPIHTYINIASPIDFGFLFSLEFSFLLFGSILITLHQLTLAIDMAQSDSQSISHSFHSLLHRFKHILATLRSLFASPSFRIDAISHPILYNYNLYTVSFIDSLTKFVAAISIRIL